MSGHNDPGDVLDSAGVLALVLVIASAAAVVSLLVLIWRWFTA